MRENAMRGSKSARERISALVESVKYERQLEQINQKIDAAKTSEEREKLVEEKFDLIRKHRAALFGDLETPEDYEGTV